MHSSMYLICKSNIPFIESFIWLVNHIFSLSLIWLVNHLLYLIAESFLLSVNHLLDLWILISQQFIWSVNCLFEKWITLNYMWIGIYCTWTMLVNQLSKMNQSSQREKSAFDYCMCNTKWWKIQHFVAHYYLHLEKLHWKHVCYTTEKLS